MVVRTKPAQFKFTHNNTYTTQTHPTMAAFLNLSTSFFPSPRHHLLPPRTTFLYTTPFSSLPHSFSSSPSRRPRFASTPILSSLKEDLGRVTKVWSDFSSLNYWVVRDYYRLVNSVNALEPHIQGLSDEQLTTKTIEFRHRLKHGETVADIQAEAFAVVREAARRKLGMRHFDVQIIGGAVLHDGSIAEMKTGEGKTLVSTLAAYLNALTGEGVHVVTVNDYLAQRDAEWMGRVHRFLGDLPQNHTKSGDLPQNHTKSGDLPQNHTKSGDLPQNHTKSGDLPQNHTKSGDLPQNHTKSGDLPQNHTKSGDLPQNHTKSGDLPQNHTKSGDLPQNHTKSGDLPQNHTKSGDLPQNHTKSGDLPQNHTKSGDLPQNHTKSGDLPQNHTKSGDLPQNHTKSGDLPQNHTKSGDLPQNHTKSGDLPQNHTKSGDLPQNHTKSGDLPQNHTKSGDLPQNHTKSGDLPQNHTKSGDLPQNHTKSGDLPQNHTKSGDLPQNHTKSGDLPQNHTKSGDLPQNHTKSVVVAQITYQSLFKLYPKLSGMTGTAKTEEKEFLKMFQIPVIEVPTNLPNIRKDLPIQAFATARGKWEHVREEVESMFRQGRPVLVGTTRSDGQNSKVGKEKGHKRFGQLVSLSVDALAVINWKGCVSIPKYDTINGSFKFRKRVEGSPSPHFVSLFLGFVSVENSEYLSSLLREQKVPHNVLNARPKYAAREAETVAQAGRKYAITISTNMAGRGTDIILGGNPKMLAKEIIEDSLLSFLTKEAPDFEVDGEPISQKVTLTCGHSLLLKRYFQFPYQSFGAGVIKDKGGTVITSEGKSWTYQEAKSIISESVEMGQSTELQELEKLVNEQSESYPLGPSIGLAYLSVLKDCEKHCFSEGLEVKRLGGLHVIGTSLHESRRIDNQLRGRAGRQGDPGSTRFMVSLQDEMFQKFNFDTEWAVKLISKITNDKDIPIEGDAIVKQLLALQINAEKYFFGIRKSLVEFDEVLEINYRYMQAVVDEIIFGNVDPLKHPSKWNLGKLLKEFNGISGKILNGELVNCHFVLLQDEMFQKFNFDTEWAVKLISKITNDKDIPIEGDAIVKQLLALQINAEKYFFGIRKSLVEFDEVLEINYRYMQAVVDEIIFGNVDPLKHPSKWNLGKLLKEFNGISGKILNDSFVAITEVALRESLTQLHELSSRAVLVKTLDCFWRDHLVNMNRLSSAVNVRSFGHRNPLEEYKIDGCRFFISMLSATRRLTVESILRLKFLTCMSIGLRGIVKNFIQWDHSTSYHQCHLNNPWHPKPTKAVSVSKLHQDLLVHS
ncbi:hypothetical protein TEA_014181 [Camellia sinensis var. sinensis]|uniref:chloroplast protein-transporting ATPase n=1 Tax=Camellia sinensis var. sinensis TaxID=542762 RepID=A0A4S4EA11_CAMSN|nr:hypothetical protein TEA_014181 [Camellia sinensis var. sinensis]